MRNVLLVPLLILILLSAVHALSIDAATPGAKVLQGGLAQWSMRDCGIHDLHLGEGEAQQPDAEPMLAESRSEIEPAVHANAENSEHQEIASNRLMMPAAAPQEPHCYREIRHD